jgi:ATP-dependent DNA ligase
LSRGRAWTGRTAIRGSSAQSLEFDCPAIIDGEVIVQDERGASDFVRSCHILIS